MTFGPLYRPPSEGKHPIVRLTSGCAHNQCTFCSMYKNIPFRILPTSLVIEQMARLSPIYPKARRLFFADGDALVLPNTQLLEYISLAKEFFPELKRIASYATVQDIIRKSPAELKALSKAGLSLLYIGLESGDDRILKRIKKGFSQEDFINACQKAKAAELALSITLISGLAQKDEVAQAANETAAAISAVKPDYLSWLTLYLEPEAELYQDWKEGNILLPSPEDTLHEIGLFLQNVDADACLFRSNHASNYLALKGVLNEDRILLIKQIEEALAKKDYRPEWTRRL